MLKCLTVLDISKGGNMSLFRIFTALFLALGVTSISSNAKASCGDVTIAEMNWASAQVIATSMLLFLNMVMDVMLN